MSLEQAIAAQTAAIEAQTAVLTKLVTATAIIAAGIGKTPATTVESNSAALTAGKVEPKVEESGAEQEPEEKKTRRQKMAEIEPPKENPKNKPPKDHGESPEGERDEAYYKAHVQPTLLELGAEDRDVLIAMFKKLGVKSGKELKPEDWDAAVISAKALLAEVKARNAREEEADLA